MLETIKTISYKDVIFYILGILLFTVFLMPFCEYTTLNIVVKGSGSSQHLINDILPKNFYIFVYRNLIFYYGLCVAGILILFNKSIVLEILRLFQSFSKLTQRSIILFFIIGVISSFFAFSTSIALKGVSVTFLQLVCVLFIANYISNNHGAIKNFYTIVLLSLIFFGGMLFLQLSLSNFSIYGAQVAGNIQKALLFLYNCLNPRYLDSYFSWFIPLLFLPWFKDYRPIYKLGSFVGLALVWFVVINHACRTIFVEYLVILPLVFIYARNMFKKFIIILVISILSGVLLNFIFHVFIMSDALKNIELAGLDRFGTSGRLQLWWDAFKVGLSHPILGVGQWNFIVYDKSATGYPHNLLLEIWSQWGIPAFIFAMIVVVNCLRNFYKIRASISSNPVFFIVTIMLVAGMFDSMLNAMFKTPLGLFDSVFVFGFCLSFFIKKEASSSTVKSSVTSLYVLYLLVLLSVFSIVILPLIYPPLWI